MVVQQLDGLSPAFNEYPIDRTLAAIKRRARWKFSVLIPIRATLPRSLGPLADKYVCNWPNKHGLTNSPSNAATCVAYLRNHVQTSPSFLCNTQRKLGEVWAWFLRYATQVAALEGLFVRPCSWHPARLLIVADAP